MRTFFNLAILLVLLAGGLVIAIALPDSRTAIEQMVESGPQQPKLWITDIGSAPYRWGFYCAMTLAILLWIRPKKPTSTSRPPSRAAPITADNDDEADDWGESVSRAIVLGLLFVGLLFWLANRKSEPATTSIPEHLIRDVIATAYDQGGHDAARLGPLSDDKQDWMVVGYTKEVLQTYPDIPRALATHSGLSFGIGMRMHYAFLKPQEPDRRSPAQVRAMTIEASTKLVMEKLRNQED
tara:strand:- start:1110 stop:1826 length:717 start_codon:yes stop_codon:yes gene_type:complete